MNRGTYFGWLFLAVWAAWLCALSGHLAQFGWLGKWAPDLGLSLFVVLSARAQVSDIAKFAICFGLARASVSIDAPAAVLAGALGLGAMLRIARAGLQVDHGVIAAALAFLLCIGQDAWLEFAHLRTRTAEIGSFGSIEYAWRAALSTAIVTALFGGVLANLPGIRGLIRRKTWAVGASHR